MNSLHMIRWSTGIKLKSLNIYYNGEIATTTTTKKHIQGKIRYQLNDKKVKVYLILIFSLSNLKFC